MLWVFGHEKYADSYSAGIDFSRQNFLPFRRKIMSIKVDPRAVRVKPLKYFIHTKIPKVFLPLGH